MATSRIFVGKFLIEQKDEGVEEYTVSMMPMCEEEKDSLLGIIRCRDCKLFHPDQSEHEYRDPWYCERWRTDRVDPDGFCAWGEMEEE